MEQKAKNHNEPLNSKDFEEGENYEFETKQISCREHEFKYTKKANEVRCNCGIGYFLSAGIDIKNGRIYQGETLVV